MTEEERGGVGADTEELLLAALLSPETPTECTLGHLQTLIGASGQRLSTQIELAAAIESLRERELIETATDSQSRGEMLFALTDSGRERARDVRTRLASAEIELQVGEEPLTTTVEAAAERADVPLLTVIVESVPDGTYYRAGSTDQSPDTILGRSRQLDRWNEIVETVCDEETGRGVWLTGPGGIGKTTLAEALLEHADDAGLDVVRTACRDARSEPYQPIREAVSSIQPDRSPFADVDPTAADAETFEAKQRALFHDLADVIAPDEDEPPRLFFVDDLHLGDAATRSFLEYLAGRLPELRLLVVGCYRPVQLPTDRGFATDADVPEDAIVEFDLEPLELASTRGLIERTLDVNAVPDSFVSAVHERTDGIPLFVEATLEALLETGALDPRLDCYPRGFDEIDLPDEALETIEEQLAALDEPARRLLQWAALVGDTVRVDVLRRVCDFSEDRLETMLNVLVEADVFDWAGDDRRAVTFRSEVVHDAVSENGPPAAPGECHSAVASALEESVIDEESGEAPTGDTAVDHRAAVIAAHYRRAGEHEAAIEWYREAGRRASELFAQETAIEQFEQALELAKNAREEDHESVLSLSERLVELNATLGEYERANRYVTYVRERSNDPERRVRMALESGRIAVRQGRYERAVEEAIAGRKRLDADDPGLECRLLGIQAEAELERGHYDEAAETARLERDQARQIDDPLPEARALRRLGTIARKRGELDTAREHTRAALDGYRDGDDRYGLASVHKSLGNVRFRQSDYEHAREHWQAALEGYEELDARHGIARVRCNLGLVDTRQGNYERAIEHLQGALEAKRAVGDRHRQANTLNNLGIAALRRGEYDSATEHLEAALEIHRTVGDRHREAKTRVHLGDVALMRGNYERARTVLDRTHEKLEAIGDRRMTAEARLLLGRLAMAQGDIESASESFRTAFEQFRTVGEEHKIACARIQLGRLAIERGNTEEAAEQLETALSTFESTGDCHGTARVRRQLGRLAALRDEPDRARERLRSSIQTLDRIGAAHDAARARADLGVLLLESGDTGEATEQLETACSTFEAIGAVGDALDTLSTLVTHARKQDDRQATLEYRDRAQTVLEDCSADRYEAYRDRFDSQRDGQPSISKTKTR